VSHRSSGTPDTFVAYLVIGVNIGQIRTDSSSRSGHIEGDDRLLEVADDAGETARFTGASALLANPMSAGSDAVFKSLTSIHFGYILRD
jgi:enolase